jgi:hypothetical protein
MRGELCGSLANAVPSLHSGPRRRLVRAVSPGKPDRLPLIGSLGRRVFRKIISKQNRLAAGLPLDLEQCAAKIHCDSENRNRFVRYVHLTRTMIANHPSQTCRSQWSLFLTTF